jgi:2,3-bisphosphoglycerate-independent phosphoglycerate mutase
MGDYPIAELGGRTPLEAADTPFMDRIASGRIGLARTIPPDMEPGSDVANLSLLGYDPRKYHTGRGPLEAASMGVALKADAVAFRMNLVTLELKSETEIIMLSHSSGDISSAEAHPMVASLAGEMPIPQIKLHPGVAYRHLLVWPNGPLEAETIPPHDVLGQNMAAYLNRDGDNPIPDLIRRSWNILRNHPVNLNRRRQKLKEANSIWPWGQGKAPRLPPFDERFGLRGGVISAVDLLKGIGVYAGLEPIPVRGATGYLDTNFRGKGQAAVQALERLDFIFVHVEAPDEAGHSGSVAEKIQAIEAFDARVVGTVLEGLRKHADYRVMVVSDHLTPIVKRTHTPEPTPFAWADKAAAEASASAGRFTEADARESGVVFETGHALMPAFLDRA